ncbi:MAG: glutathione peroxidase [Stagnimonas sp.]|nr:glutathione peroxidase [Stagnimonas sp.]
MRRLLLLLSLLATPALALDCAKTDLDFDSKRLLGKTENLCQSYGGKVVLVVNVASHCGFTPQYEGLESLYKTYKDQGLVVLGFPSGQFLDQEFDDEKEIQKFCQANYGVSFPMFAKTEVKGDQASPFYRRLKDKTGESPSWNFNKYLIGRDGRVVRHYGSKVKPDAEALVQAIKAELAKPGS